MNGRGTTQRGERKYIMGYYCKVAFRTVLNISMLVSVSGVIVEKYSLPAANHHFYCGRKPYCKQVQARSDDCCYNFDVVCTRKQ